MGTALITGASSGLGVEYAWQLAAAHHDLVLVARRSDLLEEHAERIRQAAGVRVEVLPHNLGDRDELDHVANRLRSERNPVGLLVNNAGFGLGQRFVTGDLSKEENALDVLVRAVMVLSHAASGAMVAASASTPTASSSPSSSPPDPTPGNRALISRHRRDRVPSLRSSPRGTP